MKALRIAAAIAFVGVLAALWAYLFANTREVDTGRHNASLALVQQLKQVDAEWNVDVLKAQIELNKNYDPLVRPIGQMAEAIERLQALALPAGTVDPAVSQALKTLGDTVARKAVIVDRFKTHNAVVKNSLRYLPTAHAELRELLRGERREPAAGALELGVGELVGEVLKYNAAPDVEAEAGIRATAERVRSAASAAQPPVREAVENLLTHAAIVLRERLRQVALLEEVAAVPVAAAIDAVPQALGRRFDAELQAQGRFQGWLVAYSGFALLAIAVAIGWLAYRSRTEVRRLARAVDDARAALRQSEAQLVHAEKMSMMGEIVSGIVHEINTPLGYLRSGLQSTRENLTALMQPYVRATGRLLGTLGAEAAAPAAARELQVLHDRVAELDLLPETLSLLDDGIAGVQHIHDTVVNLLNFSRLDRSRIARARVESGLDSTLKLASHILKDHRLEKDYGDTAEIHCDLSQLNQVFLNVVKNAVQATPRSGVVRVSTAMENATTVRVDISDTGTGIPPEVLPHIFDAFFTTKRAGSGTGLGLSISKRIVESHGGEIRVAPAPGGGTTFTILLPLVPPASLAEPAETEGADEELTFA